MLHSSATFSKNGQTHRKSSERLRGLGYVAGYRVNLHGEQFQTASDPYIHDNWVAVRVTSEGDPSFQTLRLPVSMFSKSTISLAKHAANPRATFDPWNEVQ